MRIFLSVDNAVKLMFGYYYYLKGIIIYLYIFYIFSLAIIYFYDSFFITLF